MLLTFSLLCAAGLLDYCNFGPWTFEEDQQLKKNWKKIVEVCVFVILILLQRFFQTVGLSYAHAQYVIVSKQVQSFKYACTIGHGGVNKRCEQT